MSASCECCFCQVEDGFELLASTQGMETTLDLYQAHSKDILQEMKVGVAISSSLYRATTTIWCL